MNLSPVTQVYFLFFFVGKFQVITFVLQVVNNPGVYHRRVGLIAAGIRKWIFSDGEKFCFVYTKKKLVEVEGQAPKEVPLNTCRYHAQLPSSDGEYAELAYIF